MFTQKFWDGVEKHVDLGYISKNKHLIYNLFIYNYTHSCQYDWVWNEYTLTCRGLITDENRNIISRPFQKFFSIDQLKQANIEIPNLSFEVYEKYDGSLGVLYKTPNGYSIATRGSFHSEQAIEATKILNEKYSNIFFDDRYTYLFEIIYPENRIVVDYNNVRDLILLAIIDKKTGRDLNINDFDYPFLKAKKYNCNDFSKIMSIGSNENREGFVVKFSNDFRVKMKFEEYQRIHKIISNFSEKRILEMLIEGEDIDELIKNIPDEFYNSIKEIKKKFLEEYNQLFNYCSFKLKFFKNEVGENRKNLAFKILTEEELSGALFALLDNKDIKNNIWKIIKRRHKNEL